MECIIPSFFIFCICLFFHEFSHATFAKSFNANVCEIVLQTKKLSLFQILYRYCRLNLY